MENLFIEALGYIGIAFVILSFIMKDIIWLRLFNVVGAVLSCLYGFLTKTYPTAVLNLSLLLINVGYLIKYFIGKHKGRFQIKGKKDGN